MVSGCLVIHSALQNGPVSEIIALKPHTTNGNFHEKEDLSVECSESFEIPCVVGLEVDYYSL